MFSKFKLKATMAKKRMTISDRQAKTGISFDTISKILNTDREPNTVTLGKLAAALGVEPEELMKNED